MFEHNKSERESFGSWKQRISSTLELFSFPSRELSQQDQSRCDWKKINLDYFLSLRLHGSVHKSRRGRFDTSRNRHALGSTAQVGWTTNDDNKQKSTHRFVRFERTVVADNIID